MNNFWDDFYRGYNVTRDITSRNQQQKDDEALGNVLAQLYSQAYDQRNQAALAPLRQNVDNIADSSLATALDAALGGTDEEKQAAMAAGASNLGLARAAQTNLNDASQVYTNPMAALQGLRGRQLLKVLPIMETMNQNKVAQYDASRKQALRDAVIAGLPPEQRRIAQLNQVGVPADVLKLINPQDSYAGTGGVIYNKVTGKVAFQKPEKPTGGQQVKLQNGNIGIMRPDGSIQDTGTKFYVASKTDNNSAMKQALQLAKSEDAGFKTWQNNPLNKIKPETEYPRHEQRTAAWAAVDRLAAGGSPEGAPSGGAPAGNEGMSPVMQRFVDDLNYSIETKGKDWTRQWIKANAQELRKRDIDPDAALTWIP